MPEDGSGPWEVAKSLLLPFDVAALESGLREIYRDIIETSWIQLFNRLEAVSLLILIPGLLILISIFASDYGFGFRELRIIGVPYAIGIAILAIYLFTKAIVRIIKKINTGQSVWVQKDTSPKIEFIIRIIISSIFLLSPLYIVYDLGFPIGTLIIFLVMACTSLGLFIAGFTGLFSSILMFRESIIEE